MYLAYDYAPHRWPHKWQVKELKKDWGLGYWLMPELMYVNLDCNVCVWIVPGTVDPSEG